MTVLVLNFSHPLTSANIDEIAVLMDTNAENVRVEDIPVQVTQDETIPEQVIKLVESAEDLIKKVDYAHLVIAPPGLSIVATGVAEYLMPFAPHWLARSASGTPPVFSVYGLFRFP